MRKNAIKLVVLACTLALGAALAACTPQESATQANQAAGGVAEEHSSHGGVGTAVSRALAEECPGPMRFVGMDDRFGKSGEFEELMAYFGLDSKAIVKAVKSLTLK